MGVDTSGGTLFTTVANGASAVGFNFNTSNSFSTGGSKLVSFQNNATEKFAIDKEGHIITSSTAPAAVANTANAGSGATCAVAGSDTAGTVTITTGTGSLGTNVDYCTVTFGGSYGAAPKVKLGETNQNAPLVRAYTTKSTTTFVIYFATAASNSTTYTFDYVSIQ